MAGAARAALLAAALALSACATTPVARGGEDRLCAPPHRAPLPAAGAPAPADPATLGVLRARGFSPRGLAAAQALGVTDLLHRVSAPEAARRPLEALRDHLRLSDALLLAVLGVDAAIAHIACERERGRELRARLQARLDQQVRQAGLLGVAVGAVAAAASGGLSLASLDTASNIAGIVGGGIGAGLSAVPLFASAEGALRTPDNPLIEPWEGPRAPAVLPPAVWQHLNQTVDTDPSARAQLLAAWRAPDILGPQEDAASRARAALLLGEGGLYTPDLLDTRDEMLAQLGAAIALMSRDLRVLLTEIAARR
ncbi:MAG: hypothetical protein MUF65_04760 [Rubritepida sp.]|nr:hypothetical protein [Rubritepida sp.]